MSTEIKITADESEDAACILSHFDDAVMHFETSKGGCSIPHYTVMMAEGRLQGITSQTREGSIRSTAKALRDGHKFAIDKRPKTNNDVRQELRDPDWHAKV